MDGYFGSWIWIGGVGRVEVRREIEGRRRRGEDDERGGKGMRKELHMHITNSFV
jgi:hypothetical protein